MIRGGSPPRMTGAGMGVSRFEVSCGQRWAACSTALIRRWGRDRALPASTVDDLCDLTRTALAHGMRFGPSSVCVRLRWADPDHVRVDVEWHGLCRTTADEVAAEAVRATAPFMDGAAVRWGVERGPNPVQWMVVDASPADDGSTVR